MAVILKAVENSYSKKNILKETRDDVKIYIGSSYKRGTRDILRGLSPEEEKEFLPSIIGVQPSSEKWDEAVRNYWANFQFKIPLNEGLRLENRKDENGKPINLDDYIKYRFALESSKVATEDFEVENPSGFSAIMIDEEEALQKEIVEAELQVEADKLYIKLIDDNEEKKKHVFYMLREVEDGFPHAEKKIFNLQLKKIKDRDIQAFINIVNDPNLAMKVLIKIALERGILEKSGNALFYMDELIGENEREAILHLESPANTKTLAAIKQAIKKPK